ncbi:hypothetical protein PIB30_087506 [Stylosanthes scabra]|uniref:PB1-like domain-containing protein n=1 Tax=Stylosanthes scabra TaxID=79078 RepID=A0ABU6TSX5_9FABA|nr:hypothetical protein [Stylosanthes scabra]
MVNLISLFYHHKGRFERNADGVFEYIRGMANEFPRLNAASVKKSMLEGFFKSLGYIYFSDFYWAEDEQGRRLKLIMFESDVARMIDHAKRNGGSVHVFWEHVVDSPIKVEKGTTSKNINQALDEEIPQPEPTIQGSPEAQAQQTVSGPGAATQAEIPTQQSNNIKKNRRASYKRLAPTGQKFVHGKRGEAPKIYVPRVTSDGLESDDDSDADPDYHQYESEDLHSPLSLDCDDEYHSDDEVWP